jgi:hypothetical protein
VKQRALFAVVAVAAVAVGIVLLVDGDGGGGPTAQQVEQRVREGWSIGGRRASSVGCRPAEREDYFDCQVFFGRRALGEDVGPAAFGYTIRIPGTAPEKHARQWLSNELSRWSGAARSYKATLERCVRQSNRVRGFIDACTRESRLDYQRATARLQLLDALRPPRQECARGLARAKSIAADVTEALAKASGAANERLLNKADHVTRRNIKSYDELASTLRQVCA